MNNIMVDIETLGTVAGSKILSIGAVWFGPKGLGHEFYRECSIFEQDGTVDLDTVRWWDAQSDEAKCVLLYQGKKLSLRQCLIDFSFLMFENLDPNNQVCVWGNGAAFDNAILQYAYKQCGLELPWKFYNDRCYRTLKNLAPDVEIEQVGTAHNALDDAKSQALHAIKIINTLDLQHLWGEQP